MNAVHLLGYWRLGSAVYRARTWQWRLTRTSWYASCSHGHLNRINIMRIKQNLKMACPKRFEDSVWTQLITHSPAIEMWTYTLNSMVNIPFLLRRSISLARSSIWMGLVDTSLNLRTSFAREKEIIYQAVLTFVLYALQLHAFHESPPPRKSGNHD